MKYLRIIFNWMLVAGLILMVGRILTAILTFLDIPFISFFRDYSTISISILIIGLIGSELMKQKNKET